MRSHEGIIAKSLASGEQATETVGAALTLGADGIAHWK
jgi:hypothetical protein